jgi:hypothetical protein
VGVITKKKTIPITIGATIEPKSLPNLNHIIFNGVNNLEFIKPKIKKIIATKIDQTLNGFSLVKGHRDIIKKTKKKTIPKLRFELILYFELFRIIHLYISSDK